MEGDYIHINKWLMPFSWCYGMAIWLRNTLFEIGVLKSRDFNVPIIAVGNITVGGTGKTPHVEYLIRLLQDKMHVAVLSRGYKRKTNGFIIANNSSTALDIGDEPFQMKQKFPKVVVAVDKDRAHGIDTLMAQDKNIETILLDDAFQHRYVKPGINILLVDYHRLIIYDTLLPAGRLREPLKAKNRADIVIITKCPKDLKPMNYRVITKAMDLYPYQHLYFTTLEYGTPKPLFENECSDRIEKMEQLNEKHVLLITGIASPRQMIEDLAPYAPNLTPLCFPDHHNFRTKDIAIINKTFKDLPSPKCIITTEKDATRIIGIEGIDNEVRKNIHVLPVHISFIQENEKKFNENILGYVFKNSRNSILAKSKDDNKSQNSNNSGNRSRTISFRNN